MQNKNIKGNTSDNQSQKTAEPTIGGPSLVDAVANAPKPISNQPATPVNGSANPVDSK